MQATRSRNKPFQNTRRIKAWLLQQFLLLATSILDVPNSYFTHEPILEIEWLAFRRQSGFPVREQQTIKNYATDVAELYLDLESLLYPQQEKQDKLPRRQRVSTFEQAEKVAETLREAWELDDHPIDSLVRTVEDHLVIVITWDKDGGRFDWSLLARSGMLQSR
jgi:hypothetical protein